jgi:hypothetical protein
MMPQPLERGLDELRKKEAALEAGNTTLLRTLEPNEVAAKIARDGEAERDEMWSFSARSKTSDGCGMLRSSHRRGLGVCFWASRGPSLSARPARP